MSRVQAALYARVSSEQQAEAGTSASQIAALEARISADGLDVAPERRFVDEGYSGTTLVRPALERLRDLAAAGGVDRLYVHSPDRLARRYAYQVLLLDEFGRAGVEVVFLNRPIGENPEDELLLQVQGMVAEYERAKILERSRRGKRHQAERGSVNVLGGAPYGYRYVSKAEGGGEARYEILPEEARVVQQIFAWVGRERLSVHEVCRRLSEAGEPTRTGKTVWNPATVWGMLKNPAYKGAAAFGKTRCDGAMPKRLRPHRGRPAPARRPGSRLEVPDSEWLSIPVPALVDEALFATVQEQLAENRRRTRVRERGARYLLQGLVVCAQCGYAYCGKRVNRTTAQGQRRSYGYYLCIGNDNNRFGGERICSNPSLRIDRLDEAVWQAVRGLLEEPERLAAEYQRRLEEYAPDVDELAKVETHTARLKHGLARLIDSYAEGLIDKAEFEPRITRMRTRLEQLEAEAGRLAESATREKDLRLVIGQVETFADRVRDGLDHADASSRRELIRALVRRIEVEPGRVRVVFRVPPASGLPGGTPVFQDRTNHVRWSAWNSGHRLGRVGSCNRSAKVWWPVAGDQRRRAAKPWPAAAPHGSLPETSGAERPNPGRRPHRMGRCPGPAEVQWAFVWPPAPSRR